MSTKSPRLLTHLFKTKTDPIEFDVDGTTEAVVLVKPNDLDMEVIERRSSAARARAQVKVDDHDSDEYLAIVDRASFADRDTSISTVVARDLRDKSLSIYYQTRQEPEWFDEDYLLGLEVAYYGDDVVPGGHGMTMQFLAASPPEDETFKDADDEDEYRAAYTEATRVLNEIGRFQQMVRDRTDAEREGIAASYKNWGDDELRDEVIKTLVESHLEKAYSDAYEAQTFLAVTRTADDLTVRYFDSVDEIRQLDDEVLAALMVPYAEIIVPALEGKGWPGRLASSVSSAPTATAPSTDSGQPDVAA